jgi:hypothetical protein
MMNLYFLPGDLHLNQDQTGLFVVTMQGKEVLRTRSQRSAVSEFNKIRKEMESRFPAHELSSEDIAENRRRAIQDWLVQHNSLGGRKKKTTAGSTRTFGG